MKPYSPNRTFRLGRDGVYPGRAVALQGKSLRDPAAEGEPPAPWGEARPDGRRQRREAVLLAKRQRSPDPIGGLLHSGRVFVVKGLFGITCLFFLLFCLSARTAFAKDIIIEVIHQRIEPTNEIEQRLYDILIEDRGTTWGNYYYKIYTACKEDVLLNKSPVPPGAKPPWIPEKVLQNGLEIKYQEYLDLIKSGEITKYKVIHYLNTPQGLLQLGRTKGKEGLVKPRVRYLDTLISARPPGAWYTSPYFLGGAGALVLGVVLGGPEKEKEPPPYQPPPYQPPPPNSLADSPWPMFRHDLWHTGRSSYPGPDNARLKWSFGTGSPIDTTPAIGPDGTIYVYFDFPDQSLYAFRPDGSKKWRCNIGMSWWSSPAIARDGTIYIGCQDVLRAIRPDGGIKWEFWVPGMMIKSSPAIGKDGTVYFGCADGNLYAIDQWGGYKWEFPTGPNIFSSPAIGPDGAIYFGNDSGYLYAVWPNGEPKWQRTDLVAPAIRSSPAIDPANNALYVGVDQDLRAFDLDDGGDRWSYPAGSPVNSSPAIDRRITDTAIIYVGDDSGWLHAVWNDTGFAASPPVPLGPFIGSSPCIDDNGIIYVGSGNRLYAINPDPLSIKWSYGINGSVNNSSPAIGPDNTIYIGSDKFYALSDSGREPQYGNIPHPMFRNNQQRTGQSICSGPRSSNMQANPFVGGQIESSPAINSNGYVYFGTNDPAIHCYDADGNWVWDDFTITGTPTSPAVWTNGRVYFGADNGCVYCYNTGTPVTRNWIYQTGVAIQSSVVVTQTGAVKPTIYVGSNDANLYALTDNDTEAAFKWQCLLGGQVRSSPALGSDGTIYVGCDGGKLYAIIDNGVGWSDKWPAGKPEVGTVSSAPAVASNGKIYVANTNGEVYRITDNGGSGSVDSGWPFSVGGSFEASPAIYEANGKIIIYIGNMNGNFYAINGNDGSPRWNFGTGQFIRSSATLGAGVDGIIYFGSATFLPGTGYLYAIVDKSDHAGEIWSYSCSDGFVSTPAISNNGLLYVGGMDGLLHIIGVDPADIRLTKKANKQRVSIGDVITYKVTISNVDVDTATSVSLIDRIPTGFKYVKGSTLLDNVKQPDPNGFNTPTLSFTLPNVAPDETKVLSYQLVVGSGVTFGKYQNKAACYYYDWAPTVQKTSNAKETVLVVPDPLFDLGTIIGKVFDDKNGNGIQDQGEKGIKDAQIVTEEGIIVTTDKDGKYHIPGVAPGTHLLKLQVTSDKRQVTTPVQARVVRVTEGLLCKVNFGISSEYASAGVRSSESPNSPPQRGEARPTKLGGELSTPNSITLVLLGDAELGYSKIDKDTNADLDMHADNDARFDKGWYNKGRLAGYLKGTIKNKYLITSSLDTHRTRYSELPAPKGRGSPNEVGWRTPNSELHRYIDPDKYYPTYGDESTVSFDATNTQGPLYLKVETLPEAGLGKSSLLWGNYATGINETKLATYNRTLYGAKIQINGRTNERKNEETSSRQSRFTDDSSVSQFFSSSVLQLFGAQAYQLAAHNEFRATGGSFYYLKHKDVVEGSEQIRIEVRDKITYLPLTSKHLDRDTDYEIDYSNGRIIFKHPVSSIQASDTIISTNILNGNPVYVVVDYEYQPDRLHLSRGTYGGRLTHELPVAAPMNIGAFVGITYVSEEESDKDYELWGADFLLSSLPFKTELTGEYAESVARGIPSHISLDGGLSFDDMISTPSTEGAAYTIRTQTDLPPIWASLAKGGDDTKVQVYYQQLQAGFTSSNIMTHQGTKKYGGSLSIEHPEWLSGRSTLRYDAQELLRNPNTVSSALVGGDKTGVTSLQTTYQKDRLTLTGEYRYQKVKGITSETNQDTCLPSRRDRQASLGAVRVNYTLPTTPKTFGAGFSLRNVNLFLGQQGTFKGDANYQTTAGASAQITDFLSTELQGTSGTQGNSLLLGLSSNLKGKTQVYTNIGYQMIRGSDYQGEKQTSVATGLTSQITSQTRVYAQESRTYFGKVCAGRTSSSATAVGQETRFLEKLRIGCNFERGFINNFDGTDTVRKSGSVRISYLDGDHLIISSKIEARVDAAKGEPRQRRESIEDKEQYLFGNNVKYQLTEDLTLLGRANWSRTDNKTTEQTDALFREYGIGLALRPVKWDKLNLLGKYTYLVDNKPTNQEDFMSIDKERANVYALEGAYDISRYFQVVEKYAVKEGEEKVAGYDWVDSRTTLWLNRLNYHLLDSWTVGLEYRILTQDLADDQKQGFLVEAIYKINQYVQLGAGYNFTDFTDDLINEADYSVKGPFIRLLATIIR